VSLTRLAMGAADACGRIIPCMFQIMAPGPVFPARHDLVYAREEITRWPWAGRAGLE
jgi:hypothetical protein